MPLSKTKQSVFLFLIVSLAFGVYVNSLSNNFVWDDKYEILNNDWIKDARYTPDILFSHSLGWLKPAQSSTKYGPLKLLVRLIQYHIAGSDPWIYQLTNVFVHVMCAVMVFFIATKLFIIFYAMDSPVFSLAAALLFAVHPIHTEPVNWAIGLSELSMSFFCLLSFYLHIKAPGENSNQQLLSGFFMFIALLFKVTAVFFILVFMAYDYAMVKRQPALHQSRKFSWKSVFNAYWPLALAVAGYLLLFILVIRGEKDPVNMNHIRLDTYNLLLNVPPLFMQYMEKLFLPLDLNALYVFHPVTSPTDTGLLTALIFLVAFVLFLFISLRKKTLFFLCCLWIAAPLLPCLYLPATGYSYYVFAERYLYLPSAGFVIAVVIPAIILTEKYPKKNINAFLAAILVTTVICFAFLTLQRNHVWKDDYSLWSDTVKKSPDSAIAHNNLGGEYEKKGLLDDALREYETAISLTPVYMDALENRFRVLRTRQ